MFKRILALAAFASTCFLFSPSLHAQANGNANSNPNSNCQISDPLPFPVSHAVKVLKVARPFLGLPLGQLVSKYVQGECVIELIDPDTYLVSLSGGPIVIVAIESL